MKKVNYIKTMLFLTVFTFLGCQEENKEFGNLIPPTNITLNFEIIGQDVYTFGGI